MSLVLSARNMNEKKLAMGQYLPIVLNKKDLF